MAATAQNSLAEILLRLNAGLVSIIASFLHRDSKNDLDLDATEIPLTHATGGTSHEPYRIVVFRRPIEHRAEGPAELAAVILAVLVDQVADLLGVPPAEVHPDYPAED